MNKNPTSDHSDDRGRAPQTRNWADWPDLLQRLPETLKIEISWCNGLRIEISSAWVVLALLALIMLR